MTIELRSLRISAELDTANYVAPAQQKVAADKAMAASGKEAAAGIAAVGTAAAATETKVSQSGNVLERLSRQFVDGYGSAQRASAAISAFSREMDVNKDAAARMVPFLEGVYRKYGQLADASQFAAKGQMQFAAAITETTARLQTQEAVIERGRSGRVPIIPREQQPVSPWGRAPTHDPMVPANQNVSSGASRAAGFSAGQQLQDIVMMTALGQAPLTTGLQQGPQLATAIAQGGGIAALRTGLMSLISPTTLITVGLVAAGSAAYQFFASSEKAKTLEDRLKETRKAITDIGDAWGYAAEQQAKANSPLLSGRGAALISAASEQQLRLGIKQNTTDVLGDIAETSVFGRGGAPQFGAINEFKAFDDAIKLLNKTAKDGTPDIAEFRRMVSDRWALDPLNDGLTKAAGKLVDLTNNAMEAIEAIGQLERMRVARVDAYRQYGLSREAGPDSKTAADNLKRRLDAENDAATRADMTARTFAERLNAARMGAEVGDPIGRGDRVRVAVLEEQIRQEAELRDATKSRADAQRQAEEQATLERMSVGKTVGEIERLNVAAREYQSLREQSERTGLPISDKALENVKAFAKAMGDAADATARLRLQNDLAFEREQLFRTPNEQAIASRLRDTGMSLNGPEAQQMRDNQRFAEAKEMVTGFASDFKAALLDNGGDIGDAFAQSILNAASKAMDKAWENIFDQLGNAVASWMTGVTPGGGGAVAGAASLAGDAWGGLRSITGGANDNYAPGAVTRAPLGGGSVAEQAWSFFKGKGLEDHQVAGILGNIKAESAFNPKAVGDAGQAFGLFQHNDRKWKLFQSLGGMENLGDTKGQLDFAWKELQGPENKAFQALLGSKNVKEATGAFAGFERPQGFSWQNPEGAHNFGGRLAGAEAALGQFGGKIDTASKALDTVTTSAVNTGQGLGTLGNGLQQAGASLVSGAPAAASGGGGGGFLGFLGSLFGGVNLAGGAHGGFTGGSSSLVQSTHWFANGGAFAGGNVIPFANGDVFDRPSYFPMSGGRTGMMGEAGPEAIMPLRRGSDGKLGVAAAKSGNDNRGREKIELHVHVNGGSGDDHIRKLSQQGAQAALAEYHQAQVQGGIGETQKRFASQKG